MSRNGMRGFCLAIGLLCLTAQAATVKADIFKWEYIDPTDPSQGNRKSATLTPGGAHVNATPNGSLSNRDLTMAYLTGVDLTSAELDFDNESGLKDDGYDIQVKWEQKDAAAPDPAELIGPLRSQLGLELTLAKRPWKWLQ
jgi:hypothetical protein